MRARDTAQCIPNAPSSYNAVLYHTSPTHAHKSQPSPHPLFPSLRITQAVSFPAVAAAVAATASAPPTLLILCTCLSTLYFGSSSPTCHRQKHQHTYLASASHPQTHQERERGREEKGKRLTILSNLQAGSLGCAPTPSQYRARATSRRTSFTFRGAAAAGVALSSAVAEALRPEAAGRRGMGSYVPRTSRGFELRAVLCGGLACGCGFAWVGGRGKK